MSARDESAVPVRPELPEPEPAAEQLDFLHRITLPELRREIEHHKDGKARWRKRAEAAEARVAELEAERHTTNEALSDAAEALRVDRDRIAELEKSEAIVAEFVAARAEYITNLRNCNPDNGHDYDRWQGHAAARRQLAQALGSPVAWPEGDAKAEASADKLTRTFVPVASLREPEGEHYQHVHHDYRVAHDLPKTGGAQ